MVETPVEAQAEKPFAAGAERRARCQADIGFVDNVERGAVRIRHSGDTEEEIERAFGHRQPHPPGRRQGAADTVAGGARAFNLFVHEGVALFQRRNRAALQEMRHSGIGILHQVFEQLLQNAAEFATSRSASRSLPSSWKNC